MINCVKEGGTLAYGWNVMFLHDGIVLKKVQLDSMDFDSVAFKNNAIISCTSYRFLFKLSSIRKFNKFLIKTIVKIKYTGDE